MAKYIDTEPLKAEIKRQAAEITRLLAENKELKETKTEDIEHWCDICTKQSVIEQARAEGQNEAWELARKITCQPINGGFNRSEFEEIFDEGYISDIFEKYTYTEAAKKVAEWEEPCRRCARNCKDYWKAGGQKRLSRIEKGGGTDE